MDDIGEKEKNPQQENIQYEEDNEYISLSPSQENGGQRGEKEKNPPKEYISWGEEDIEYEEDNGYISLPPWSEEDIEIDKMKKRIDELEEIKSDHENLLKWKRTFIEEYKNELIKTRNELPKYYKKIEEKNLHATCINGKI